MYEDLINFNHWLKGIYCVCRLAYKIILIHVHVYRTSLVCILDENYILDEFNFRWVQI